MKSYKVLIVCLGMAVTLPATAADEATGEYSDLQPSLESKIEAPPEHLDRGTLIEATATVVDIDHANRLVTIQGPEGRSATVTAGPEVKNLDQVKVGDQISVKYYQSMAVDLIRPGEAQPPAGAEVAAGAATAAPGEKPAGIAAKQVRATIEVITVDPYKKTISFRGPDGRLREVSMDTPDLKHYLDEIKDGDTVEVVYTEALAIAVTPQ
jgi:hypothetical protein